MKTNVKYISISNMLRLLSAAGTVPHTEPIQASLVVESSILVSFSAGSKL